jgi:hypothetical protein
LPLVIALENIDQPLAQRYLFKLLDISHKHYLDVITLREHLKSVQARYYKEMETHKPGSSATCEEFPDLEDMVVYFNFFEKVR